MANVVYFFTLGKNTINLIAFESKHHILKAKFAKYAKKATRINRKTISFYKKIKTKPYIYLKTKNDFVRALKSSKIKKINKRYLLK